ncbi:hypothetical protein PSMK_30720 [Phycisphaera mikurensis NBRC 102666]|uniref:Transposase IS200-like domain-containing protein n=2 Tax=Phycisphaera TaxID=666508 RepID=I0IIZ3_PHYMF|nr:hypothetical protein PSMK_30720 [Phycisphaera mikurensis NBRC 102666]
MARRTRSCLLPLGAPRFLVHCVARCTRQLHMLADAGGGAASGGAAGCCEPAGLRKEILLARLEELVGVMAVEVIAFAVMDNHVHLVLRVSRAEAQRWSDEQVLRRWWRLHPLRDGYNRPREAAEEEVASALADAAFLAGCREKLASLSKFMQCFSQHAAERINKLEQTGGPVWAGRFKSVLVKDLEQLVATMVYVDLNPFAAGVCETPEEGRHTSLAGRLGRDEPCGAEAADPADPAATRRSGRSGRSADREPGEASTPDGPRPPRRRPSGRWLRPLDESLERQRRRGHRPLADGEAVRAASAGTVAAGLSLRAYLRVLDAVARKLRKGKRRLAAGTAGVFERLGLEADAVAGRVLALVAQHAVPPPRTVSAVSAG